MLNNDSLLAFSIYLLINPDNNKTTWCKMYINTNLFLFLPLRTYINFSYKYDNLAIFIFLIWFAYLAHKRKINLDGCLIKGCQPCCLMTYKKYLDKTPEKWLRNSSNDLSTKTFARLNQRTMKEAISTQGIYKWVRTWTTVFREQAIQSFTIGIAITSWVFFFT